MEILWVKVKVFWGKDKHVVCEIESENYSGEIENYSVSENYNFLSECEKSHSLTNLADTKFIFICFLRRGKCSKMGWKKNIWKSGK